LEATLKPPPAASSNLCANNGAVQSILNSTSTGHPTKSLASINPPLFQKAPPSPTIKKAVSELTAEELLAFLDFLRQDKTAVCDPNSGATSANTTAEDSATTNSTTTVDSIAIVHTWISRSYQSLT
jgi:hypothetical protein